MARVFATRHRTKPEPLESSKDRLSDFAELREISLKALMNVGKKWHTIQGLATSAREVTKKSNQRSHNSLDKIVYHPPNSPRPNS